MNLKDIAEETQSLIKHDIKSYLGKYAKFIEFRASSIVNLFNGTIRKLDKEAFEQLDSLYAESFVIQSLIDLHKQQLTQTTQHWVFLEVFSDIRISLQTLNNCQKWTRSSVDKNRVSSGVQTEVILTSRQNLEQLSRDIGASNKDEYWLKIALDNDLREEDYTDEGGNSVIVSGSNRSAVRLKSVIDTEIRGKKIYGIDIQRKIEFNSDEEDLQVLSYDETLLQTVNILATLGKRDTPEFEEQGLQREMFNGANRNSLPYPVLIRQYYETFAKDDSFKSILVKDIKIEQDSLSLVLECETKIREKVQEIIPLI